MVVENKNTNKSVNFFPNSHYLSSNYCDDYRWEIKCEPENNCSGEIVTYLPKILYATKNQSQDMITSNNLIAIKMPGCNYTISKDYFLFLGISVKSCHQNPILKYYGSNQFNCSNNYTNNTIYEVRPKRKQQQNILFN